MVGTRSRIPHRPLPENDPKQRQPNISRAQNLLVRKPQIALKDGVTRIIAYFDRLLSIQALRDQLLKEPSLSPPRFGPTK